MLGGTECQGYPGGHRWGTSKENPGEVYYGSHTNTQARRTAGAQSDRADTDMS
jgi:hypothetical protein